MYTYECLRVLPTCTPSRNPKKLSAPNDFRKFPQVEENTGRCRKTKTSLAAENGGWGYGQFSN